VNIFYLSSDPIEAAKWMVDKHVVKMIVESAQLLSTAHRVLDGREESCVVNGRNKKLWVLDDDRDGIVYAATHINHPSAIWTRQSVSNYNWLVEHFFALMQEYTYRYGKTHKCQTVAYTLQSPPNNLKQYDMTTMPSAMAEEYVISEDPIINYRNYYKHGKSNLHAWKNRQPPEWITV